MEMDFRPRLREFHLVDRYQPLDKLGEASAVEQGLRG
jgi:hypothetical protein